MGVCGGRVRSSWGFCTLGRRIRNRRMVLMLLAVAALLASVSASPAITYAVNCGGGSYVSTADGISYQADRGFSSGIVSDFGKTLTPFPRVSDDFVYQTERYDLNSFTYSIPIKDQGIHTIVLKFSEVYFEVPFAKVFDVKVGGRAVVNNLDIFSKVGKGVPHDERIEVERVGDKLLIQEEEADAQLWNAQNGEVKVEFVKRPARDNPKVNAIVVYKAEMADVPSLPPYKKKLEYDKGTATFAGDMETDDETFETEHRNIDSFLDMNDEFEQDEDHEENIGAGGYELRIFLTVFVGGIFLLVGVSRIVFGRRRTLNSEGEGKPENTGESNEKKGGEEGEG